MNLDTVRKLIREKMYQKLKFIYRAPRNQIEEFEGRIIKCFSSVFVVETSENSIKSFSYNDFIMKNIKIISSETK